MEGCETDFGFVPYSPATLSYLGRVAPLRSVPKRRSKAWKESQRQAEKIAAAANVCAAIHYASSGRVLELF